MSLRSHTTAVILPFVLAVDLPCQFMAQNSNDERSLSATVERLNLTIPLDVVTPLSLRSALEELARVPCNQTAIANLDQWLEKAATGGMLMPISAYMSTRHDRAGRSKKVDSQWGYRAKRAWVRTIR
jgi:hypothetical protein